MSQITQEQFFGNWKKTEGIDGAHFGILNTLETREIVVQGWPIYYFAGQPIGYIQFLSEVVNKGDDDKGGAKALQVLLKHLQPPQDISLGFTGGHEIYQGVMRLLCSPDVRSLIHRAPISTQIRELIGTYRETIWRGYPFQEVADRRPYLENWIRLVFVTGNLDALDKIRFHEADLPAAIEIIEQVLREAMSQKITIVPPRALSELARKDEFWARRIKAILYLRACNGDFDQLIPLR